jgi:DNA-directed RNA polymerase beta' subunit
MAAGLLSQQIIGARFSFYSDADIRRLSVKQIVNPITLDAFGHATAGGVYDKALGPSDFNSQCPTCGLTYNECPGHIGHIELNVPVYNPTLFTHLYKLLRMKCLSCNRLRIASARSRALVVKLMLLDLGRVAEALDLDTRLAAVAKDASDEVAKRSGAAGNEEVDAVEAVIERQAALLRSLELDCIAAGGRDVGCGLGIGAGQYSAHIRSSREEIIKSFLASFPPKSCHNCDAAMVRVSVPCERRR